MTKTEIVEVAQSEIVLHWEIDEGRVYVRAWLVASRELIGTAADGSPVTGPPLFEPTGADWRTEETPDPEKSTPYVCAVVKSDGCSQVNFGRDLHLCGRGCWQTHVDLMRYVWRRAFELMDSPYPDEDTAPLV